MEVGSLVRNRELTKSVNLNLLEAKLSSYVGRVANNGRLGTVDSTEHLRVEEILEAMGPNVQSADSSDESVLNSSNHVLGEIVEPEHLLRRPGDIGTLRKRKGEGSIIIHFG